MNISSANKWINLAQLSHEPKANKWVLVGVIVLVTFISFSPALKNNFINWDDNIYVSDNKDLAKPILEGIKYFFGIHYYAANYTPVTMIIYALEYHSFGINPELYHLVNILIHLLNAMLVFWFIYLLSGKKLEVAAIVSLFFGIHPMHVESVAWIAELKDVLYTFFFIGGLITYYKYIQSSKSKVHYSLTFILYVISVLSKPAAVTFPILLLLIDFYTKRKFDKYVWLEKLPFFIISLILGIITIKAQQQAHAMHLIYTIFQRVLFACYSILGYIVKLLLPIKLSALYPYPLLIDGHLPYFFYFTPFIALFIFYCFYQTFKYSRLILFGFLFFFLNILLVLQLLSFGSCIMADRYTYIPCIGLFFIIAMGFSRIYNSKERKLSVYKLPAVIVIIIIAITSSYLTYARCQIWKTSETLWRDALNKFPDNPTAFINLADSYNAMHDYDNALKNIDNSLKYAPQNPVALNNKGSYLFKQGKYKEAMTFLIKAIQLEPDYSKEYFTLADCYNAMHDFDNVLKNLNIGLNYEPDNYKALNSTGYILYVQGKYKEAIKFLSEAIRLNPNYSLPYTNLADCYNAMHDYDNAIFYWKKSLEFNPGHAGTYKMVAVAYQNKGDNDSANVYYAKAKKFVK